MLPDITPQQQKINKFFKMYPTRDKSKEGCYFLDGKSLFCNPYKHSVFFCRTDANRDVSNIVFLASNEPQIS